MVGFGTLSPFTKNSLSFSDINLSIDEVWIFIGNPWLLPGGEWHFNVELMLRESSKEQQHNIMADYSPISSQTEKYKKPASFPRLLTSFTTLKSLSETFDNAVMSPTSILDTKPFSSLKNPFWPDQTTPKTPELQSTKRHWDKLEPKSVSLGLVDVLIDEKPDSNLSKPESSRMVLFGSQLKIQIPPLPPSFLSPAESPKSPGDFGIKTRNSNLGSFSSGLSPSPIKRSVFGSASSGMDAPISPSVFTGCLSASEMELSEDYTCVISHIGPTPRTTHIFDNCIVDSFCFSASRHGSSDGFMGSGSSYPPDSFLSFCYACKKNLGQGKDIYMYRGEKAFCSNECRYQEILLDEGPDKLDPDEVCGT